MRKIHAFFVTTADGYYEGPNGEFDWPVVDDEFNELAIEQLDAAGTLMFGRVTYEVMAQYWPTPQALQDDPRVASRMNGHPKIVVSTSLDKPEWENTRLINGNVVEEIKELKDQPGKDVVIMGSSSLTASLVREGLVDEIRIMVNPVILGAGKSLFRTAEERIGLKLLNTRTLRSGNVLLTYEPVTA
ncbi:dihydrofolate reductase family protein [Wenjunlia tyrosinilytica]|jgi:dihydrofolate reductase|uniref:Bacterial bifunctional deaminase-reductase C-terminal domain-containing protein n=1 Tax=Wenjunlia tyrosinilytica TaxID=1544741 RepID=A0A917ZU30_9ACTN|nr:dihydrofolate reductase family protein [Wenjunlia tyrosinilytica]GGO94081.1 hypothetical protein GCM10012280_48090 [Wenjunlia tyrosinilytica]